MNWSLDEALYACASETDRRYMERISAQEESPCPTNPTRPHETLVVGLSPFTTMRGWEYYVVTPYEGVSYRFASARPRRSGKSRWKTSAARFTR